jgi:hypothetical protein
MRRNAFSESEEGSHRYNHLHYPFTQPRTLR